ncbi:MAG: hypothetical protein ACLQJR_20085 [Stellaceae bacterium]
MIGKTAFGERDRAQRRRIAVACALPGVRGLLGLLGSDGALRLSRP